MVTLVQLAGGYRSHASRVREACVHGDLNAIAKFLADPNLDARGRALIEQFQSTRAKRRNSKRVSFDVDYSHNDLHLTGLIEQIEATGGDRDDATRRVVEMFGHPLAWFSRMLSGKRFRVWKCFEDEDGGIYSGWGPDDGSDKITVTWSPSPACERLVEKLHVAMHGSRPRVTALLKQRRTSPRPS